MINEKSLKSVETARFSREFCKPLYASYCFSQIPQTVLSLFSSQTESLPQDTLQPGPFDQVIVILLDAFGWRFFNKFREEIPSLEQLIDEAVVSKLTSMFPSTTAAHITCLNTGLTPGKSGIYEWFMYEPKLDQIIAPLLFATAGDHKPDSLRLDPKKLYPSNTLYHQLEHLGVSSFAFQPKNIANSVYSNTVLNGAEVIGYHRTKEAFEKLLNLIHPQSYTYFYYPDIDSIGHRRGVHSSEFSSAINGVFSDILELYQKLPRKTAFIITADHGMVEIDPETTYYLNQNVPNIEKYLQFGQDRKPLIPAGSCRDFFLHVQDMYLSELKDILEHFLKGKAEVYLTQNLVDLGFFGSISEKFTERVGNLVILPYAQESVWWYEKGRFEQNFYAAHGGLTREEMEIPFIFLAK